MKRKPGLVSNSGDEFLTGYCDYSDFYPGQKEPLARIYVPFRVNGLDVNLMGLLDTGGHFCILSSAVACQIWDGTDGGEEETRLLTAQGLISGKLYRHTIAFLAEKGDDLELEATVFVSPDWQRPSILGYTGLLERIRFAIDPWENRFYFGP